jgi:hypothetical protein
MVSSTELKKREKLWRNIWKADVPPKVLVFAWRLASNGLASNTNKKTRHIIEMIHAQFVHLSLKMAHAVGGMPMGQCSSNKNPT